MKFDYEKICKELLEVLPERTREVISRRFGLGLTKEETLEAIGKDFGVCRERVRQIENSGLSKLRSKTDNYKEIFKYFRSFLQKKGGLSNEQLILSELGGENFKSRVFFLLNLNKDLTRINECKDFYPVWTIDKDLINTSKKIVDLFYKNLNQENRLLCMADFELPCDVSFLDKKKIISYVNTSKNILQNKEGYFGLSTWPEINPKKIKDKAFVVLKKKSKPLHFRDITNLIGKEALPQTVHNELIRDERFVLVGRGLYALKNWGYTEGVVKDIIIDVLKKNNGTMEKGQIISEVSKQRMVKRNTILLNLNNKKYFLKTQEGYTIKES